MHVPEKILPSIRLPEIRTSVHYTGQDRELQLTSFRIFTAQEVLKASRPKRKAPQPRGLVNKWAKADDSDSWLPSTSTEDLSEAERSNLETEDVCTDSELSGWGEDENNKATQTEFNKH